LALLEARVSGPRFFMIAGAGLVLAGAVAASAGLRAGVSALTLGGDCVAASGLSMALVARFIKTGERRDSGEIEDRDRLIVIPPKVFPRLGGRFRCKEILLMWRARSDILAEIGEFKATRGGKKRTKLSIRELMDVGAGLKVHTYFDEDDLESVKAVSHALGLSPMIHHSTSELALRRGDLVLIYEKEGLAHLCFVEKPSAHHVLEVSRI